MPEDCERSAVGQELPKSKRKQKIVILGSLEIPKEHQLTSWGFQELLHEAAWRNYTKSWTAAAGFMGLKKRNQY